MSHLWHYTSTTPKHESLWHNASRRREYPELSKMGLNACPSSRRYP